MISILDIANLLYYFVFLSLLIVGFAYDLKFRLIPDFVSYGILLLGLFRIGVVFFKGGDYGMAGGMSLSPSYDLFAVIGVALAFGSLWFFSKGNAMGFGDVKLASALTAFLGFPKAFVALLLAFWIGSIFGIALMASQNASLKTEVPFGPFLVIGALLGLLWGADLITYYLSFCLF